MTITHIFFDVHGVLVDRALLGRYYTIRLGQIMSERYGFPPIGWTTAYRRILADWDSYYTDLNLSGDDGVADMWEGIFRTTRALFRLTGVTEPDKRELTALAHELPGLAAQGASALYLEVPEVVAQLDRSGMVLGVISHSLSGEIRASLESVAHHFKGAIWSADNSGRFDKDVQRFQAAAASAGVAPEACLFLDDKTPPLIAARNAGMNAVQICRELTAHPDPSMLTDLRGLVNYGFYEQFQSNA